MCRYETHPDLGEPERRVQSLLFFPLLSRHLSLLRFSSCFIYTSDQKNPIHRKCLWLWVPLLKCGQVYLFQANIPDLHSASLKQCSFFSGVSLSGGPIFRHGCSVFVMMLSAQRSDFLQVSFYNKSLTDPRLGLSAPSDLKRLLISYLWLPVQSKRRVVIQLLALAVKPGNTSCVCTLNSSLLPGKLSPAEK